MQIAIDGPAGAGKSSVARGVASFLGLKYLDTGAMYRAITLKALRDGVDLNDNQALVELVRSCHMDIKNDEKRGNLICLDGEDVSTAIRSPAVNDNVSIVAKSPNLRKELVALQKKIANGNSGIVMEGRDIGTNVIADADYKFFLFADLEERARRRWLEMKEMNMELPLQDLLEQIAMRDRIDQERKDAPLKIAPDAVVIDTTFFTLQEVINKVLNVVNNKTGKAAYRTNVQCDEGC
jgi:cytidylate kinase